MFGRIARLKTEARAWREVERKQLTVNPENPKGQVVTFGGLLDRYVTEELPYLRHSTGESYASYIKNHVKPKWGDHPIAEVKPYAVEQWLRPLQPNRQRGGLSRATRPPPPRGVPLGDFRVEHVPVGDVRRAHTRSSHRP